MKKILLTGAGGFVGKSFFRLLDEGSLPYQLDAGPPGLDIRDTLELTKWITDSTPDWVIHLAAQSHVPTSFQKPRETYDINFLGTLSLLESLTASRFSGTLLYVGSADVYGKVDESHLPISEQAPLQPRNPYAVSKAAAELLCQQWSMTSDFGIVLARPFNHIGPGQGEGFAISNFAKQFAEVSLGRREPILEVGDVEVSRDFSDVDDVLKAYLALLEKGEAGQVYNVCSGIEYRLSDLIQQLARIAKIECEIKTSDTRLRKSEQRRAVGDNTRITRHTGWSPSIPIEQSLERLYLDWRQRIQHD